jgi:hypothetical protein
MGKITLNFPNATDEQLAGATIVGGGGPTPPPPTPGGHPLAITPADGATYSFHGFPANYKVSTQAGGDGRFSAATPGGNSSWKVWVNGQMTIDGSMDMSPVKGGDTIEWMITTPAYQDDCTYSISLPA